MKAPKLTLDIDEDDEITIGLMRLVKDIPDHELFFQINNLNALTFKRIDDILFSGYYYDYHFSRYEAFHNDSEIGVHIISNRCTEGLQKKKSEELFSSEEKTRFLLQEYPDVDYLLKTSEPFGDFSVILLPENLMFKTEEYLLSPEQELYQLIQYYE